MECSFVFYILFRNRYPPRGLLRWASISSSMVVVYRPHNQGARLKCVEGQSYHVYASAKRTNSISEGRELVNL